MFSLVSGDEGESAWTHMQRQIDERRQEAEPLVERVKRKVSNILNFGFWETQLRDARKVLAPSNLEAPEISSVKLTGQDFSVTREKARSLKRSRAVETSSAAPDEKWSGEIDFESNVCFRKKKRQKIQDLRKKARKLLRANESLL